jgi:hypothetical protein
MHLARTASEQEIYHSQFYSSYLSTWRDVQRRFPEWSTSPLPEDQSQWSPIFLGIACSPDTANDLQINSSLFQSVVIGGVLAGGAGLYGLVGKLKGHRGIRRSDTPAVTHTRSHSFDLLEIMFGKYCVPFGGDSLSTYFPK